MVGLSFVMEILIILVLISNYKSKDLNISSYYHKVHENEL